MEVMNAPPFDVVIVGAGPAGLSAALMLGRCRRRVVVCDDGRPRNAVSSAAHGFFTRDGERPDELLRVGRAQLSQYGVELVTARAADVRCDRGRFVVALASREEIVGRRLLLATGVLDSLPPVVGIETFYGTSAFHCPYCDGWEARDRPLAAYARGHDAVSFALVIQNWSRDLVLCTDGRAVSDDEARQLDRHGIPVRTQRIRRLVGQDRTLEQIVFEDGSQLARHTLFFDTRIAPRTDLAVQLGCELTGCGLVQADERGLTTVAGVYVAGDVSEDLNFVSIAAAEGSKTAVAIHRDLQGEDLDREGRDPPNRNR
jgi:thioredoxin reductase